MSKIMHVYADGDTPKNAVSHFRTINEAFAAAKARKIDDVELHLHPGNYTENIKIEKPLTIVGEKTKKANVILSGSIDNSNGRKLMLRNVTIENPKNHGILQVGGSLELQNVTISGGKKIRTTQVQFTDCACISVLAGAKLQAKDLILNMNSLIALSIDGENTKAIVSGVSIMDNKIPATFVVDPPIICGAIDVANSGTLCIEDSVIVNNEYIGICIHDKGKMHLRNTTVTGTKNVLGRNGKTLFGDNIFIASGAIAELRSFTSSCAQGVGILINEAYLTAENGNVASNLIGICFFSKPLNAPSYDPYNCIYDNVQFIDNITKNGSLILPVLDLESPDRSSCKKVLWG